MINHPDIISTLIVVCALIGFVGGGLGFFVFLDFRRKRHFVDYMNRRLSGKKGQQHD